MRNKTNNDWTDPRVVEAELQDEVTKLHAENKRLREQPKEADHQLSLAHQNESSAVYAMQHSLEAVSANALLAVAQARIADFEKQLRATEMECGHARRFLRTVHADECEYNFHHECTCTPHEECDECAKVTSLRIELGLYRERVSKLEEQLRSAYEFVESAHKRGLHGAVLSYPFKDCKTVICSKARSYLSLRDKKENK